MSFEIAGEKFDGAFDWRTGHGDEIAEAFALVEGQDFAALFERDQATLALLNFFKQHRQSVRFHAAGRALTAGFHHKKLRDLYNFFDDAVVL
jgi:hypothetical protein